MEDVSPAAPTMDLHPRVNYLPGMPQSGPFVRDDLRARYFNPTTGEVLDSAWEQGIEELPTVEAGHKFDAYEELISDVDKAVGTKWSLRNPYLAPLPHEEKEGVSPDQDERIRLFHEQLTELARRHPNVPVRSHDQLMKAIGASRQVIRERYEKAEAGRAGFTQGVASFAGSAGATMIDPVMWPTYLVGGGLGGSAIRIFAREAIVGAGSQAASEYLSQEGRKDFGETPDYSHFGEDVFLAGAGSGVLGLVFKGVGVGFRKLVDKFSPTDLRPTAAPDIGTAAAPKVVLHVDAEGNVFSKASANTKPLDPDTILFVDKDGNVFTSPKEGRTAVEPASTYYVDTEGRVYAAKDHPVDEPPSFDEVFQKEKAELLTELQAVDQLPEELESAAVYIDGKVYTGSSHADAMQKAIDDPNVNEDALAEQLQDGSGFGFTTTRGRFISLNDAESVRVAHESGQMGTDRMVLTSELLRESPPKYGGERFKNTKAYKDDKGNIVTESDVDATAEYLARTEHEHLQNLTAEMRARKARYEAMEKIYGDNPYFRAATNTERRAIETAMTNPYGKVAGGPELHEAVTAHTLTSNGRSAILSFNHASGVDKRVMEELAEDAASNPERFKAWINALKNVSKEERIAEQSFLQYIVQNKGKINQASLIGALGRRATETLKKLRGAKLIERDPKKGISVAEAIDAAESGGYVQGHINADQLVELLDREINQGRPVYRTDLPETIPVSLARQVNTLHRLGIPVDALTPEEISARLQLYSIGGDPLGVVQAGIDRALGMRKARVLNKLAALGDEESITIEEALEPYVDGWVKDIAAEKPDLVVTIERAPGTFEDIRMSDLELEQRQDDADLATIRKCILGGGT